MYQIREGQWDESISMLRKIILVGEKIIKLASFVILEQKFFELMDGGKIMDALETPRTEIVPPLCINDARVRELSSFIVSVSENIRNGTSGEEVRKKLLGELLMLLPPSLMISENRLVQLVEEALVLQKGCL
ncbi:hypothetical protein OROMI_020103 [Orobanche minor]